MRKFGSFKKAGMVSGKGVLVGLGICAIAFLVISANIPRDVVVKETEVEQCIYRWTPYGSEGTPGAGASGFIECIFLNISSADALGYGLNLSSTHETWAVANMVGKTPYGNADEFYFETESEKTFVVLVRVRFNKTHAWETDKFNGADCDVQLTMTCTDWAVGSNIANVSGTAYESRNDTSEEFIWINFVWDNSGTGYQVADDSTWAVTEIYIEAKF